MDITTLHDDASLRLHRIQFAVRNRRWWEARVLLAEADAAGDWCALGHASADGYRAAALGLGAVSAAPLPARAAG